MPTPTIPFTPSARRWTGPTSRLSPAVSVTGKRICDAVPERRYRDW
jgi:hypothetical protein